MWEIMIQGSRRVGTSWVMGPSCWTTRAIDDEILVGTWIYMVFKGWYKVVENWNHLEYTLVKKKRKKETKMLKNDRTVTHQQQPCYNHEHRSLTRKGRILNTPPPPLSPKKKTIKLGYRAVWIKKSCCPIPGHSWKVMQDPES